MRRALALVLLAATLALPAAARAASYPIAHAGETTPLRAGPGASYRVVGELAKGTEIRLVRCIRQPRWCLVLIGDEPAGWARGFHIVGAGAKLQVSPPPKFLGFDPLDPLPSRKGRHRRPIE